MATLLPPTPEEVSKPQVVSTLLTYGLYSYQWTKALTVAQVPAVAGPLAYIEDKVSQTTTDALTRAKLTPEGVVATLDSKAAEYVDHYELESKYASAKTEAAKQILKLKGEDALTAELAEEIELAALIADAREVAWERVSGLQTKTSDRVDKLLENAETYVEKVLPAQEAEAEAAAAADSKKARITSLSTTVTRRFKKRAMAKLEGVTLKLRKSTSESPIVHLDLVRYAELLDLEAVRERVATVGVTVQSTETYAVVKGYVVQASDLTEKLAADYKAKEKYAEAKEIVEVRLLTPAKDFYAVASAEFLKRTKSAEDLAALGLESVQARREFAEKYIESLKTSLGAAWSDKLVKPAEEFLSMMQAEWEPFRKAYSEGVQNPNITTEDGKPYTIDAGVEAFVTALRLRLAQEWETRVVPSLDRLKAKVETVTKSSKEERDIFVDCPAE